MGARRGGGGGGGGSSATTAPATAFAHSFASYSAWSSSLAAAAAASSSSSSSSSSFHQQPNTRHSIRFDDVLDAYARLLKPRPRLLLVFEDVEALAPGILEDFLRLAADAAGEIQVSVVVVVSPAYILDSTMSASATGRLESATFSLIPSRLYFTQVIVCLGVSE